MTRRFATLLFAALAFAPPALAQTPEITGPNWRHGVSLFGDVKYPADFKHFDYVNADAPKGGTARLGASGTFDSFNAFIPRGNPAAGINLVYDTLMAPSLDEPGTQYGLIAESVRRPDDFSSATFRLRPEAKWQDGQPVTVDDVIWSFDTLKRINPLLSRYYHDVVKAEASGPREVTFRFSGPGNRELPFIVGELQILPKHFWEGSDDKGDKRDIERGTLEKPLGSGPYRIKEFTPGRSITYERVPDYWGATLPVKLGTDNFDQIRWDYFRDTTVLVEAFKGDQVDYREENSAKNWATAYNFPAVEQKRVVLEKFRDSQSGRMQAYAFNLRRDKFSDARVRKAFNLAFDFEEINRTIMFGQYVRIDSYFFGTDLASKWLPEGREKEILESVRDKIPPEVFTTPYANPVGGSPEAVRANLRKAFDLLKQAGWTVKRDNDGPPVLRNDKGEPFTVEFIYGDPSAERILSFYVPALQKLGVQVTQRLLDDSQYGSRIRSFDFDMVTVNWGQSLSPGNEQRDQWGGQAADVPGSHNFGGVKDAGVDALVDKVIYAKDRDELIAATHALDRVLLAHDYVVPQFSSPEDRTARWDRFSRPPNLPPRGSSFPTVWWWDADKAKVAGNKP